MVTDTGKDAAVSYCVERMEIMIEFWRIYLIVVGVLFELTGLEYAFFQNFVGVRALTDSIAAQIAGGTELARGEAALASLYLGVVGAVTVFMGSVIAMLAIGPFKRRDPWAWTTLAISLASWYVVDTAVAALAGATVLIGFNTAVLAVVALPLLATWRSFFGASREALA